MAIQKMTFSLDALTVARIGFLSKQLGKAKSAVVREAVALYKEHADRVTEEERLARVRTFEEFVARIPARPREDVEAELKEIRRSRRAGWRPGTEAS